MCSRCELGDTPCRNCPLDKQVPDLEDSCINEESSELILFQIDKKGTKHIKRFKRQEEIDNKSLLEKKRKTEHDNSLVADLEKFLEISDDECEPKARMMKITNVVYQPTLCV